MILEINKAILNEHCNNSPHNYGWDQGYNRNLKDHKTHYSNTEQSKVTSGNNHGKGTNGVKKVRGNNTDQRVITK